MAKRKLSLRELYQAHERVALERAPSRLRLVSGTMPVLQEQEDITNKFDSLTQSYQHESSPARFQMDETSGPVLLDPKTIIDIVGEMAPGLLKILKDTEIQHSVSGNFNMPTHTSQASEKSVKRSSVRGQGDRQGLTSSKTAPAYSMFGSGTRQSTLSNYSKVSAPVSPGIPRSFGHYNLADYMKGMDHGLVLGTRSSLLSESDTPMTSAWRQDAGQDKQACDIIM